MMTHNEIKEALERVDYSTSRAIAISRGRAVSTGATNAIVMEDASKRCSDYLRIASELRRCVEESNRGIETEELNKVELVRAQLLILADMAHEAVVKNNY